MSRRFLVAVVVLLVAAAVVVLLPFQLDGYHEGLAAKVAIFFIAVLGLNILTGYTGQISIGHGAFMAIGGYTTAVMSHYHHTNLLLTLPLAFVIAFGFGVIVGIPALRFSGVYLALATFALAVALPQLLKHKALQRWTGGVEGITLVKPDAPFGLPLNADRWLYFFSLAIAIAMFFVGRNLLRGRIGRAMVAIRDNPIAAEAMGIDIALYKSLTFGVSAMFTGVGGALGAIAVQFVAPDSFGAFLSIAFLVGVVVGGLGTIQGAVYGALFIQFVPNIADRISKAAPWAIYGIMVILFMYLAPGGVAGFVHYVSKRWRRRT